MRKKHSSIPIAIPKNPRSHAILAAGFLLGVAAALMQAAWTRRLEFFLGGTVYTAASVLACFMLGLAVGSFWGARRKSDANRRAMILLAGLGVFALASPWVIGIFESMTRGVFAGEWAWGHSQLVRGILIGLFLASPTFLMGAVFPALVRLEVVGDQSPRGIGRVFGAVAVGGAAGFFMSGFYLLAALGVTTVLLMAAGICLLALMLLRKPGARASVAAEVAGGGSSKWIIFGAMFVAGFVGLSYENVWTRILTYFFRDSIFDLSIVRMIFFLGLMIGAAAGVELLRVAKKPQSWFAFAFVALAIAALLGLFIARAMPYNINDLKDNTQLVADYPGSYWAMGVIIRMGVASVVLIVPAALVGMMFPLAMRICSRDAGMLSGASALGGACGAIVTPLFLIGSLQLSGTCVALAMISAAAGAALLLLNADVIGRIRVISATTAAIVVGIVGMQLPAWDALRMSNSLIDPHSKPEDVLKERFHREDEFGATSVVQLKQDDGRGTKYLVTNRLFNQSTSHMRGLEDLRRLGHIPMFLHPSPKRALVLGLRAGITLRAVAEHEVEAIDCVEVSGAVVEAAKYFERENAEVLRDPRVKVIVDDGRAYVAASAKQYDVIIASHELPTSAGAGAMFTADFYGQCKSRLATGGVMCQWLRASEFSESELKIIFRSFQQAFPHATIWFGLLGENIPVVGMIATDGPMSVDDVAIGKRLASGRFGVSEINLNSPHLLLSGLALTEIELRGFVGEGRINTDDRPVTEFSAPKSITSFDLQGVSNMLAIANASGTGPSAILPVKVESADFSEYAAGKRAIIKMFATPPSRIQERYNIIKDARLRYPQNEELEREYELQLSLIALEKPSTRAKNP